VTDLPEIFARERAPVLPVVDRSGALLGVVWRSDVAQRGRAAARDDAEAIAYALGPTARTRTDRAPAISETSSLGEAAKAMARLGVRALVVVDESGRVVGLLSDVALLRAFATARAPHP
jgi:CBS-domain-containing membrane protein